MSNLGNAVAVPLAVLLVLLLTCVLESLFFLPLLVSQQVYRQHKIVAKGIEFV